MVCISVPARSRGVENVLYIDGHNKGSLYWDMMVSKAYTVRNMVYMESVSFVPRLLRVGNGTHESVRIYGI